MQTIDMGGHSGCRILLCEEDNNDIYVRKISSGKEYNKRLLAQSKKQSDFCSQNIKAPHILKTGYTIDGFFYFDMEYIQGVTLAEYMKNIEIGKVRRISEILVENIVVLPQRYKEYDEMVFIKKIESLNTKLKNKHNTVINSALDLLISHSWKKFVKTPCHGDLTLENIIVKDNQLYVIDFLDSFYDSWIMDISTIMQDVQIMWSYRYQDNIDINTILRLMVFRDILMDTIKEVISEDYIEVYYALLLKLIRIYPYVQDERTYKFLNEKTNSIIEIINKGE